ncbi:Lrp/AsnC family transcriptional regulator [Vibrio sp. CDRSL-10 TSBA]
MDKFDNQIIALLQRDARMSVSDIAREVSLSRSAVTARIKKLEQDNIILGYHAQIAHPEQHNNVSAYFALKFDMAADLYSCEKYAEQLYRIPGVKWCHAISGETDLMIYVEAQSMAQLNAIRDELQQNPQLRNLRTHTVLKELFNTTKQTELP